MMNKFLGHGLLWGWMIAISAFTPVSAQLSTWVPDELKTNEVKIVLNRETSEQELTDLVDELAEEGVKLKIKQENRSASGELHAVKGILVFPDGNKSEFRCKKMGRIVITRKKVDEGPISVKVKAGRNILEWIR